MEVHQLRHIQPSLEAAMSIDWVGRAGGLKLRVRNFIDGRWKEESGDALAKYGPRDGKLLCRFGAGEANDVDETVVVARRSFEDGRWSKLPVRRRKDVLQRLAPLIEAHREELALLECLDVGKPITDAFKFDVPAAAEILRHAAETVDHIYGKVYGADASSLSYELRRPLGVVAGIVGWNFPLVLAMQKIGPALVTGNSLVLKPSEFTCGGKAPNIVFDDCPSLDAVAESVVARAFWNQGQVCTASSRLLIQESRKDELLSLVMQKVSALSPGDPLREETRFGAVVSREHQEKVLGYLDSGEKDGARKVYQSSVPPPFAGGFYVSPTIFDQVLPTHKIAREEIFGPVLSVISFADEKEAIRFANDTIYGLSAILWTQDLGRAHRVTHGIRAGWISVNATGTPVRGPSGGVISVGGHKESGWGVEGGIDGLKAFTSQTAVQWFI